MSRYVEVPFAAVLALVSEVRSGVESRGGSVQEGVQGREVVFDITPPKGGTVVRFYTSAAKGAQVLRACDSDAVRVVVGVEHDGRFRPTHKSQKLLRTAPRDLTESERVDAFIGRVREALREGYRKALKGGHTCPDCGTPMALRKAKKTGSEFLGCLAFPKCRATMPVA